MSWDVKMIRSVCGAEANKLKIGTCSVRWPLILACLQLVQVAFLTCLSFILAGRQAKYILEYASKNYVPGLTHIHIFIPFYAFFSVDALK